MNDRARQFRVVCGNIEPSITGLIENLIKSCIPPELGLVMEPATMGEEILAWAEHRPPDLFVLFFNNIVFSSSTPAFPGSTVVLPEGMRTPANARLLEVLELISHVKAACTAPVLVISGYDGEPPLAGYLEELADVFVHVPIDFELLRPRIQKRFGWEPDAWA